MPEIDKTSRAAAMAAAKDGFKSVSLNEKGFVNIQLTKEEFSAAIKDAFVTSGDTDVISMCLIKKHFGEQAGEIEIVAECKLLQAGPKCPILTVPCQLKDIQLKCPPYFVATCAVNWNLELERLREWCDKGIVLENVFAADQIRVIRAANRIK